MKSYLGTSMIHAKEMTRLEYTQLRGWELPSDENGEDPGFLVEKLGGAPNVPGYDGYVSWLPFNEFHNTFRECNGMEFGRAVELLKLGEALTRKGWNGRGMFIYYVPPGAYPARTGVAQQYYGDKLVPYNAYFAIKNVDESVSTWVPSINDVLAEDWEIFTPTKEQHHA